jgi:hypothetical protein
MRAATGTCSPASRPGQPLPSHCSYAAPSASIASAGRRSSAASERAISAWWVIMPSISARPETA